ncbi:MAG: hypothetical protein H0W85_10840 [Methylotenera sp.]|nr:hypothetical protein [Methylotenera sp.]
MSKLPTTQNNLKQPSPDNQGLEKAKPNDVDLQAAEVNRDISVLEKKSQKESSKAAAKPKLPKPKSKEKTI